MSLKYSSSSASARDVPQDALPDVPVRVDESRHHDHRRGVDDLRLADVEVGAYRDDLRAVDQDVGAPEVADLPIHREDAAVFEYFSFGRHKPPLSKRHGDQATRDSSCRIRSRTASRTRRRAPAPLDDLPRGAIIERLRPRRPVSLDGRRPMDDDDQLAAFGEFVRAQRRLAQVSQRNLARMSGVSDSYLSQIERGNYRPSPQVRQGARASVRPRAEAALHDARLHGRAGRLGAPRASSKRSSSIRGSTRPRRKRCCASTNRSCGKRGGKLIALTSTTALGHAPS